MTDRKLRCLSPTFWWYLFMITVSSFLVPSTSSRVQGLCTRAVVVWSEPLQTNGRLTGYDLRFYNVYYENIVFQAGDEIFRIVKETDVPSHHGSTFVQVSTILKWWWTWNDTTNLKLHHLLYPSAHRVVESHNSDYIHSTRSLQVRGRTRAGAGNWSEGVSLGIVVQLFSVALDYSWSFCDVKWKLIIINLDSIARAVHVQRDPKLFVYFTLQVDLPCQVFERSEPTMDCYYLVLMW